MSKTAQPLPAPTFVVGENYPGAYNQCGETERAEVTYIGSFASDRHRIQYEGRYYFAAYDEELQAFWFTF